MFYKSYLGCLTGLLLLRVNLSGPPFPWQLPAILPFAGLSYGPLGRWLRCSWAPKAGAPFSHLSTPGRFDLPGLAMLPAPGAAPRELGNQSSLHPSWTGMPRKNNTGLAGLMPKQVSNKWNNLSPYSSTFVSIFFLFFWHPLLPRSASPHTFHSLLAHNLTFLNTQLLSCCLTHHHLFPYFILLPVPFSSLLLF